MESAFPKARTSPPSPKNEPSPLCRCYPYQRRSAVFIITAGYVIESRLFVIVVAAVADGVDLCQRANCLHRLSPGIVVVPFDSRSVGLDDPDYIAPKIDDIVIDRAVAAERVRRTTLVVEEFQGVRPVVFRNQLAALPGVFVFNGAAPGSNRLGHAQAVHTEKSTRRRE